MSTDEGDPPKWKVEINTGRILKPKLEKSKPEPLPRGVARAVVSAPTPTSPQRTEPSTPPRKEMKPAKDFNAIAAKRLKDEFNTKAKDRNQGNEITNRPKPTRPRGSVDKLMELI